MPRFSVLIRGLTFAIVLGACSRQSADAVSAVERKHQILEGKEFLSKFQGKEARAVFFAVDAAYRKENGAPHCEAAYGVVLADIQVILTHVNPVILRILAENLRPHAAPGLRPLSADVGADIAVTWNEIEPMVAELADYSASVTDIPDCTFSIGLREPVSTENPDFRFVVNLLDNEQPVAQAIFKTSFDGVEARVISALAHAAIGVADLVLAHDLAFSLDAKKTALQFGVSEACVEKGLLPCVLGGPEAGHPPIDLLRWAFVLADNPTFLAKSPDRWATHMPYVAQEFAAALFPLRSVFDAMLERNDRLFARSAESKEYQEYALIYEDANFNGHLDQVDTLGVNVTDLQLRCNALVGPVVAKTDAADCAKRFLSYEDFAKVGLLFLRTAASPSEDVIGELRRFVDRLYLNLHAVDDPAVQYERIPFDSFSGLFTELFPVLDVPAPNFLSVDLAAFFKSPPPIRTFLPAWESTPGGTGARFLADADDYTYAAPPPTTVTAVDVYLNEAYGGMIWGLVGRPLETTFDPASVQERDLFSCTPGEPCIPADCLNASNLTTTFPGLEMVGLPGEETWHWPVIYLWLPDSAFNHALYVDGSAWNTHLHAESGNGDTTWDSFDCTEPSGWRPADNRSLQRSLWLFADFFLDHFQLAGLLRDGIGL